MKKLFVLLIVFSLISSSSLAVVQKASPEAKAQANTKQVKTKQTPKNKSRFTNDRNKVHQDAVLQNMKYKMTIKSLKTAPLPADVHPSQQY